MYEGKTRPQRYKGRPFLLLLFYENGNLNQVWKMKTEVPEQLQHRLIN